MPRSPFLMGFGMVAAVHLALNAVGANPWDSVSKCLLAPLLAAWVVEQRGPRVLVAALTFCCAGDLLLELDGLFVAGMAVFAAAHVCFIVLFVRNGAAPILRARPWILAGYALAGLVVVAWSWGGLDAGLRPIVPVYAVLLVGTAATALAVDRVAGVGGGLFLVSDGIIALSQADRLDPDATATGLAIMSLYIAAIVLLTAGILARQRRTTPPRFDPAARTDCWPTDDRAR